MSAESDTITGSRPTNSGISPYLSRSSWISCSSSFSRFDLVHLGLRAEAHRPLADALLDDLLESLERAAADEQDVARVDLDVVLVRVLRPPCGGTLATVPSRIFSSACWTPSPDTSRVIDGLSDLRAILSISSM